MERVKQSSWFLLVLFDAFVVSMFFWFLFEKVTG